MVKKKKIILHSANPLIYHTYEKVYKYEKLQLQF